MKYFAIKNWDRYQADHKGEVREGHLRGSRTGPTKTRTMSTASCGTLSRQEEP